MSVVTGKDFVGYIYRNSDGAWLPYICATDISLQTNTDVIETSVAGNGLFASYLPTKNSFSGSISGNTALNDGDQLTLADLRTKQLAGEIFLMRFFRTAQDGSIYVDVGSFFITNCSDSGNFNGVSSFNITLQGTGPLQSFYIQNKENMNYLVYTATLTQSGTSAPVATVFENTLLGTIAWSYNSAGSYDGTLSGAFTAGKTYFPVLPFGTSIFAVSGSSNFQQVTIEYVSTNVVRILTKQGTSGAPTGTDGVLIGYPVEIRVYL